MAMSTGCCVLLAGLVAQSSARALCESGASSESCHGAQPAQDHLLIQVQRNTTSKTPAKDWAACHFAVSPATPYYWEPKCSMGMAGCWADGVHAECRFCDYAYISCPETAWWPIMGTCNFTNKPPPSVVGYYYEKDCPAVDGGLGCNADGQHVGCRFCGGEGAYASVPCKVNQCSFASEPAIPYYYDYSCKMGGLGCMADGIHVGCRFCGKRPFENVTCPASVAIPEDQCWFRHEPAVNYYWDASCTMGKVGCWADGIHAQCRFCSGEPGSPFAAVPCP